MTHVQAAAPSACTSGRRGGGRPVGGRRRSAMEQDEDNLAETTEQLLRKCGEHADLVISSVFSTDRVFHPARKFVDRIEAEQQAATVWLVTAPRLRALQFGLAECRCSPLGRLSIQNSTVSGSSLEGICDFSGNVDGTGGSSSDFDEMIELGPVLCTLTHAQTGPAEAEAASEAASEAMDTTADTAGRLAIVPTENPGFVRVLQARRPDCQHRELLPFSAASVRQLMRNFVQMGRDSRDELSPAGPSTGYSSFDELSGMVNYDFVPCIRARLWPADEFLTRQRACDWPPAAAREDIRRFGVHLVPTGYHGSATEQSEWRLSFSRAEVVASWSLNDVQRNALIALKACKHCLGADGKAIKSYYMKTALFWLCQEMPSERWRSVTQSANCILDHLEAAVDARRLPCFFWADINLLQPLTHEELEAMRRTIGRIRREMTRLLMGLCSVQSPIILKPLLASSEEPLTERQVRVCLARGLVVMSGVLLQPALGFSRDGAAINRLIPVLLRSSAAAELAQLHNLETSITRLHVMLWRAMLVAPDDVFGAARLERRGEHTFSWDAAPLVALLTAEDVRTLLWQPAAVRAWWRRQRPAALPDDPLSLHGLTQLLLNPPLLVHVLSESVPDYCEMVQYAAEESKEVFRHRDHWKVMTYEEAQRHALQFCEYADLAAHLQRDAVADGPTARRMAARWREEVLRHWSDPEVRAEFQRIRTTVLDVWQLRPFARLWNSNTL